jgi:hypothetical protein
MPVAILALVMGGVLIYSSLKGISVASVLAGVATDPLDPAGKPSKQTSGSTLPVASSPNGNAVGSGAPLPAAKKNYGFKGPKAALLNSLAGIAETKYDLRITQTCRPANATYGSPTSLHKACRAFDAVGSTADKVAFARFARGVPGVDEVFCDQAGMVAPGYSHGDHVHVGA